MRRQLFSLVVLVTLGLIAFITVVLLQPELLAGLAGGATTAHISGHFREPQHRVHDVTFGLLLVPAVIGSLFQLRKPSEHAAAQIMALMPIVALALAAALTNAAVVSFPWIAVGSLVVLGTVLHPTMGDFLRSLTRSGADRQMLGLVTIAAVPLLTFAFGQLELQRRALGEHAVLGHYGFMAAFSFGVIGIGLLATAGVKGRRLLGWVGGTLAASQGLMSLLFADVESRLEFPAALAAIGWGVAFVARVERIVRRRALEGR
jgi:hypothetical protein